MTLFYRDRINAKERQTMEYKIFDSELKILEILWEGGEASAKDVEIGRAHV